MSVFSSVVLPAPFPPRIAQRDPRSTSSRKPFHQRSVVADGQDFGPGAQTGCRALQAGNWNFTFEDADRGFAMR